MFFPGGIDDANLPSARSPRLADPRYAEPAFLGSVRDPDDFAWLDASLDALEPGPGAADVNRDHVLREHTPIGIGPEDPDRKCDFSSSLTTFTHGMPAKAKNSP